MMEEKGGTMFVKMYYLQRIAEAKEDRKQINLTTGKYLIGRNVDAEISCTSRFCSRSHAQLFVLDDGTIELSDLGTQNGTFVDDERINGPTKLQVNNLIGVGCVISKITMNDPEYYVFSLQKRENVTETNDGVICLDDDDDDDEENKVDASNVQIKEEPAILLDKSVPSTSATSSKFDDSVFKHPGFLPKAPPAPAFIEDEEYDDFCHQSQAMIHLQIKQEEEELFNDETPDDFLDDVLENIPKITSINIYDSDDEDIPFSQHFLNIDSLSEMRVKPIKLEIKEEKDLSGDEDDIAGYFQEEELPEDYQYGHIVFRNSEGKPIPVQPMDTQTVEKELADMLSDDDDETQYIAETTVNDTQNIIALLETNQPLSEAMELDEEPLPPQIVPKIVKENKKASKEGNEVELDDMVKNKSDEKAGKHNEKKKEKNDEAKELNSIPKDKKEGESSHPKRRRSLDVMRESNNNNIIEKKEPSKYKRIKQLSDDEEMPNHSKDVLLKIQNKSTSLSAKSGAPLKGPTLIEAPPLPKRRGRSTSVQKDRREPEKVNATIKKQTCVCKITQNRGLFLTELPETKPERKMAPPRINKNKLSFRMLQPIPSFNGVPKKCAKSILRKAGETKKVRKIKFNESCNIWTFEMNTDQYFRIYEKITKALENATLDDQSPTAETSIPAVNAQNNEASTVVPVALVPVAPISVAPRPIEVNNQQNQSEPEINARARVDQFLTKTLNWDPEWLNGPEDGPTKNDRLLIVENQPLEEIVFKYAAYKDYAVVLTRLLTLEMWAGIHKSYRTNMASNIRSVEGRLFDSTDRKFSTHQRLSLHCTVSAAQMKHSTPNGFFVLIESRTETAFHRIFGYLATFRHNKKTTPSEYSLTIQVAKTKISEAIAKNPTKRISIHFITVIRNDLKMLEALFEARTSQLMKYIINPLLIDTTDKKENMLLDEPVKKNNMNAKQTRAIMGMYYHCASSKPSIMLMEGPPGSGKSVVITNLIEQLRLGAATKNKNLKILVCTQSNGAADNIAAKLMEKQKALKFNLIRYGIEEKISKEVQTISLHNLVNIQHLRNLRRDNKVAKLLDKKAELEKKLCQLKSLKNVSANHDQMCDLEKQLHTIMKQVEQYEKPLQLKIDKYGSSIIQNANVVCSTLGYVHRLKLFVNDFDVCIIDEATQCTEATTLMPLQFNINNLILIGDSKQLPATVFSKTARHYNYHRSLFTRIQQAFEKTDRDIVKTLDIQYRMHPEILKFPNQRFYKNRMQSASNCNEEFKLKPYTVFSLECCQDATQTLFNVYNTNEIQFVTKLLTQMRAIASPKQYTYGVITPYDRQRKELLNMLRAQHITDVTVNTIDSFQGHEKDVIIVSTAKTNGVGFLEDPYRLNVALTRAKRCLVLCGNFFELQGATLWKQLLDDATARKCLHHVDEDVERPIDKLLKTRI